MKSSVLLAVPLALCVLGPAVAQTGANLPGTPESVALVDLLNDHQADHRAVTGFYPMTWDAPALDRREALLGSARRALESTDFEALDRQGQIDYLLFRTLLESRGAELTRDRQSLDEAGPLVPFAATVASLERRRVEMLPPQPGQAAEALAQIPEQVDELRRRIELGRKGEDADALEVSPVVALRTARTVRQVSGTLRGWYDHAAPFEPDYAWWVRAPYEEARKALDGYADFLTKTVAGVKGEDDDPLVGDPIGREMLLADLRAEWIPYTPEELITIADREFAWCEAEMIDAAREMGLGDDWRAALERVKQDHVPPGEQDDLVRELAREALDYVVDNDLLTVPPLARELWRLEMIPENRQRLFPFAYYGGNHMGVAYAAGGMGHEDKLMAMRGNNRHFTRAVVHHELIPGHHLQGFVAQRERPYRRVFSTPFLGEGWCLYWEMELYDRGFARTPEERIGMLFWRMHRCARIIVSLRFHLGEMSPEEMIDFLVERVGHERSGATGEVRRYIGGQYSPLYQAAYMLGGLQLRALRGEVVEAGDMPEKAFHDRVLGHNSIPIELIRTGLTDEPLTPDTRPQWRFAD